MQRRGIELGKCTGATARQLLKRLGIELLQERRNGLVDVIDRGKLLMAKSHQNPALDHLHCGLNLAFVLRMVRTRGQERGAVVACKVVHRLIGPGLIAICIGNQRFGVVGHDELGHAADEPQGLGSGTQPIGHGLAGCGAGIGVTRCAQGGHEDVGTAGVCQLDSWSGVVDEQFLTGAVDLAHGALEGLGVAPVVLAKLRVAVDGLARMLSAMFFPQQHQRHAFASQLLVHAAIVRLHETTDSSGGSQQAIVQCRVVQTLNLHPVQTDRCGQRDVLGDHAFRDVQGGGASLMGEPSFKFET